MKNRSVFRSLALSMSLLFFFVGLAAAADLPLRKLDQQFAKAQKEWDVPGFAIAIVKDGKLVFAKGYGVREVGKAELVDENTLFAIASNTKAFTAATIAMLVDEGKLSWDDKVIEHLPYFRLQDEYAAREMTLRDLLSHRGGLGTYSGDLIWYGTDYSAEEVVRRARYVPTASSFRSKYDYSNLMFLAAGEVVHKVSGKPWTDFVQQRILDKLAMRDTVLFTSQLAGKPNVASPHRLRDDKNIALPWYRWDNMAAAGSIISSVADMSKWVRLQLNRGKYGDAQIFSEASSFSMWSPHSIVPISEKSARDNPSTHFAAYGLGWSMKDYQGRKILAHGGGYDGMFSRVVLVPEENLGIVVLSNSMTSIASALAQTVVDSAFNIRGKDWIADMLKVAQDQQQKKRDAHLAWQKARVKDTKPSLADRQYAGIYGGPMYGNARVTLEDGGLVLRLLPNKDLVADLTHWHHDTFALQWRQDFAWFDGGTVQFILDTAGKVSDMKIAVPNEDFWFTELELKYLESGKLR